MKVNRFKRISVLVVLGLLGSQALAAKHTTLPEEKKGAIVGGIIGAGIGGPIGAVTGIIIGGGWIGKALGTYRINGDLRHELAQQRQQASNKQSSLEAEVAQLGRALNKAEVAGKAADNLELPIHFKTGSSEIEAHYQADLVDIAQALAARPDARVDLSGYADLRGAATYNQQLSEQRVRQVKAFLLAHGVAEEQIETRAYGESRPVAKAETSESDFFDRRVVMHFDVQGDQTPVAVR